MNTDEKSPTAAGEATKQIDAIAARSNKHEREAVNQSSVRDFTAFRERQLLDKIGTLEAWKEAATVNYRAMEALLALTDAAPHGQPCEFRRLGLAGNADWFCTCWRAEFDAAREGL